MSRSSPRMIALLEALSDGIADRLRGDKQTRGLLALVQEIDGDVYAITLRVEGRTIDSRLPYVAGCEITSRALGIARPGKPKAIPRRAAPRKRRPKPRPAA